MTADVWRAALAVFLQDAKVRNDLEAAAKVMRRVEPVFRQHFGRTFPFDLENVQRTLASIERARLVPDRLTLGAFIDPGRHASPKKRQRASPEVDRVATALLGDLKAGRRSPTGLQRNIKGLVNDYRTSRGTFARARAAALQAFRKPS
jgi:hypothetical protein